MWRLAQRAFSLVVFLSVLSENICLQIHGKNVRKSEELDVISKNEEPEELFFAKNVYRVKSVPENDIALVKSNFKVKLERKDDRKRFRRQASSQHIYPQLPSPYQPQSPNGNNYNSKNPAYNPQWQPQNNQVNPPYNGYNPSSTPINYPPYAGYNANNPAYNPNNPGYNPNNPGYNPNNPGYNSNHPDYNPNNGGYRPPYNNSYPNQQNNFHGHRNNTGPTPQYPGNYPSQYPGNQYPYNNSSTNNTPFNHNQRPNPPFNPAYTSTPRPHYPAYTPSQRPFQPGGLNPAYNNTFPNRPSNSTYPTAPYYPTQRPPAGMNGFIPANNNNPYNSSQASIPNTPGQRPPYYQPYGQGGSSSNYPAYNPSQNQNTHNPPYYNPNGPNNQSNNQFFNPGNYNTDPNHDPRKVPPQNFSY